jgi:predicted lipoprotein with Yx(FWY)xxD motif
MLYRSTPTRGDVLKRVRIPLAVAFALGGPALAAATGAAPSSAATAAAARAPTVRLEQTSLGKILVDGSGATLYMFTRDRRNKDRCANVSGCLGIWPALTTTHKPVAGAGVRSSLLGTIKFHGDVRQVTYAGHPLYGYVLDFGPRSTFYVGTEEYGGRWNAVNAAGKAVD